MSEGNPYWNWRNELLIKPASEILDDIWHDDNLNRQKAVDALSSLLQVCNKGLTLLLESLQAAYRKRKEWEHKGHFRAAMAMACSLFNYLLLLRHALLLGYFPEAHSLRRDCQERLTRCLVFAWNENLATKFLTGKEIQQWEIDKALARIVAPGDGKDRLQTELRTTYKKQSNSAHPNLSSLLLRTVPPPAGGSELAARVGLEPVLGGFLSPQVGEALFVSYLGIVLQGAGMVGSFVREQTGTWATEFKQLRDEYYDLRDRLADEA